MLVSVLAFNACKKEKAGPAPDGIVVSPLLLGTIGDRSTIDPTKEYETWLASDSIGLFMVNAGQRLESNSIYVGGYNLCYKSNNGTEELLPAANNQTLNFPSHGEAVDILAYYPYKGAIQDYRYPIDVSKQANQNKIDLRYSANGKSKTYGDSAVNLVFEHQLAKLYFKVRTTSGLALAGMNVALEGFSTTADFSLADQSLSNIADVETIEAFTQANGRIAEAIVIPPNESTERAVVFTLADGTAKTWPIPSSLNFDKGTRTIFTVVLTDDGIPEFSYETAAWDGTLPPSDTPVYQALDGYQDEDGNIIGMVVSIDASGRHGLAISLDERRGNWSTYTSPLGVDGTESREEMQTVIEGLGEENWQAQFESFAWCRAHPGGEWYLPTLPDLETVYATYDSDRTAFNAKLEALGGVKIIADLADATQNYWTASAKPGVGIIGFNFSDGTNVAGLGRSFNRNTRAILSF